MAYYIVNINTGRAWGKSYWTKQPYATERGAKIACTKMNNKSRDTAEWKVMSADEYNSRPVKMVERVNLMTGQPYMEAEDTPGFCSPSSEAYWSS